MATFSERMIRAARLDADLYEEVEADKSTLGQAMTVVVLSSLAAGIGSIAHAGIGGIVLTTIGALLGWYVWAYMTYFIGTRMLPEPQTEADLGQLLRTTGFSSSPGLIRVLGVIPPLSAIVSVIAMLWMLAAMIVAVRQALDYTSTWRALAVCLIGWLVQAAVLVLIVSAFGPPSV
jgi:hypothetical protein